MRRGDSRASVGWQSGLALAGLALLAGCARHSTIPVAYPPGTALAQPPGGTLTTLGIGQYVCELPGDALGPAGVRMPGEDFAVVHGSQYHAGADGGAYLAWGTTVEMTSGPRQGARYRSLSMNQLRKLNPDGSDSPLLCTRAVLNNMG